MRGKLKVVTLTVSLNVSVNTPVFMFKSNATSSGSVLSTVYTCTGAALSSEIVFTAFSFMSTIVKFVTDRKLSSLLVAS